MFNHSTNLRFSSGDFPASLDLGLVVTFKALTIHIFCAGNIRVFCRVRPFLPGEIDSSCGDGRESICSNGSRGSGKGSKVTSPATQLQICYPDKEMDRKKIALQYSSEQVSALYNGICCYILLLCVYELHNRLQQPRITSLILTVYSVHRAPRSKSLKRFLSLYSQCWTATMSAYLPMGR